MNVGVGLGFWGVLGIYGLGLGGALRSSGFGQTIQCLPKWLGFFLGGLRGLQRRGRVELKLRNEVSITDHHSS